MFERFTDRARRVLVFAQEEARLRHHGYLGTEHMLVGLIQEGGGVATKTLEVLEISVDQLREDIEAKMGPAQPPIATAPPFTPKAKKVLELALGEALKLGHNYIGTEHLLLGLAVENEGLGGEVLRTRGAEPDKLRPVIVDLLEAARRAQPPAPQPAPATVSTEAPSLGELTVAAATALRFAASRAGHRPVGTHDLLVALLSSDRNAAATALANAGFSLADLRVAAEAATTLNTADQTTEEAVASQLAVRAEGERIVIEVNNAALLAALRASVRDGDVALANDDPRVTHDLGTLWQQITATLWEAINRLDPPA